MSGVPNKLRESLRRPGSSNCPILGPVMDSPPLAKGGLGDFTLKAMNLSSVSWHRERITRLANQ